MKVLTVCLALCAVVFSEQCNDHHHCDSSITSCSGGSTLHCVNHQCTCTTAGSGGSCVRPDQCSCDHGSPHCVDGRCRCGLFG